MNYVAIVFATILVSAPSFADTTQPGTRIVSMRTVDSTDSKATPHVPAGSQYVRIWIELALLNDPRNSRLSAYANAVPFDRTPGLSSREAQKFDFVLYRNGDRLLGRATSSAQSEVWDLGWIDPRNAQVTLNSQFQPLAHLALPLFDDLPKPSKIRDSLAGPAASTAVRRVPTILLHLSYDGSRK